MRRLALFASVIASCSGMPRSSVETPAPPRAPATVAAAPATPVAEPEAAPKIEKWSLDDVDVWVSAPERGGEPKPIVVGVHGSGERAEDACETWRAAIGAHAFVVCPKGVRWRWVKNETWGPAWVLAERADKALAAVRARYGERAAPGPVVYAGFSLGATLAPEVIALRPGVYGAAIMVEVGHTPLWAPRAATQLAKGGVSKVVVACATHPCLAFERRLEAAARGGAVNVTLADGVIGRGHFFDAPVIAAIARAWPELALKREPR